MLGAPLASRGNLTLYCLNKPGVSGRTPESRRVTAWRGSRRQRQRHPVFSSSAAPGGGGASGGSGSDEQRLRDQAKLLNDLFYSAAAPQADVTGEQPAPASADSGGGSGPSSPLLLPDLPLWRVQWASLPGNQEVLHVHVPHYCDMFERLFRQPRPWRYGHLYLPEGSKNLGNPEYALEPGSKAPLAGTLMEVLQAVRFADGRLILLALGVSRFRVVSPTQSVPFSRADVELLCDVEEQQAFEGLALQALESVQGGIGGGGGGDCGGTGASEGEMPLAALMEAMPAAARQAAGAYSLAWLEYDLSDVRQQEERFAIIDGTRTADAAVLGRRLAAIAGNEVIELPFFERLGSAAAAEAEGSSSVEIEASESASPSSSGSSGGSSDLQQAMAAQRSVLRQTEAAAYALATAVASRCVGGRLVQPSDAGGGGKGSSRGAGAAMGMPPVINNTYERGIPSQAPEEVLEAGPLSCDKPDSLAAALELEAAIWLEIDAVNRLAGKLRNKASALPDGLLCLRPVRQPAGQGGAGADAADGGGAAAQAGAHPDYPPLRRLQRLSFGVAALLANVSAAEGRQAWVEAGSICARLQLGLAALTKHRQVLAAVVAVEGL